MYFYFFSVFALLFHVFSVKTPTESVKKNEKNEKKCSHVTQFAGCFSLSLHLFLFFLRGCVFILWYSILLSQTAKMFSFNKLDKLKICYLGHGLSLRGDGGS